MLYIVAVKADHKYTQINDAKFRAVAQHCDWEVNKL